MISINKPAPDYSGKAVINGNIEDVTPSKFSDKYVVLVFYSCDFKEKAAEEIIAFSERAKEFRQLNCEILGISCDSELTHLGWTKTPRQEGGVGSLDLPLVSDKPTRISRNYGVYNEKTGHPHKGVFIVDPLGVLRHIMLIDDRSQRNIDEIKRCLQAVKMVDIYGEVCPATWRPEMKEITVRSSTFTHYKIFKDALTDY